MQPQQPGYNTSLQHLELIADLPWNKSSHESPANAKGGPKAPSGVTTTNEAYNIDVKGAKDLLDKEHFGLEKVKQRIVEYIAVRKLKPDAMGPVLCFAGPPGVGKTSLAASIASALGRKFVRIALGGVKDEADIRGHRRTYVGSMPGRIIEGLKRVGVNNPVMLLDELDKTGTDARGDPASALLEVLDPEQNKSFTDHYVGLPFDLSKVIFVATANRTQTISPPLLDRMEVIQIPGYTPEEKKRITLAHLIPRTLESHGLTKRHLIIQPHIVDLVIQRYTREAGVRTLTRHLAALARAAAVQVAQFQKSASLARPVVAGGEGDGDSSAGMIMEMEMGVDALGLNAQEIASAMVDLEPIVVTEEMVEKVLGPSKFDRNEVAERVATPGVAVGLVWTAVGGEVQFVEASKMAGKGDLKLTGQLGDVIKESAVIALTWVRSHAAEVLTQRGGGSNADASQGGSEPFDESLTSEAGVAPPAFTLPTDVSNAVALPAAFSTAFTDPSDYTLTENVTTAFGSEPSYRVVSPPTAWLEGSEEASHLASADSSGGPRPSPKGPATIRMANQRQDPSDFMANQDIHIHFPSGGVPKDGPSAGITLVTALVSLLSQRCVRADTAMTGEITLRGLVLPVGGLKEKILAAHRCGVRRVILPHQNLKEVLSEVPAETLACMELLPMKRIEDVLNEAFEGGCPAWPIVRSRL